MRRRIFVSTLIATLMGCAQAPVARTMAAQAEGGCPQPEPPLGAMAGTATWVSPEGDDITGDGSLESPYGTLGKALADAGPGTRILVRGGVFEKAHVRITAKGAPGRPIVIAAYSDERPVFDGTRAPFTQGDCNKDGQDRAVIQIDHGAHLVLDGLEVARSEGCGVNITAGQDVTIRNFKIHDIWSRGLGGSGSHLVFENNEITNAVLQNEHESAGRQNGGFWSASAATWTLPDGSLSRDVTWRGNTIRGSWGEGLSALLVDGAVIEGNRLENCYSACLYVDHSRKVTVNRNLVRITSSKYNRTDQGGAPAIGIFLASEFYPGVQPVALDDVRISNNLLEGVSFGVAFWQDPRNKSPLNTYRRMVVAHNAFGSITDTVLSFPAVGQGGEKPVGNEMVNNQVSGALPDKVLVLGEPRAWRVAGNRFDGEQSAPPVWNAGVPEPAVTEDFVCHHRDARTPSIGPFERPTEWSGIDQFDSNQ
ncbi:MAG TPA: right-handed parallel beta-helix repeat-containing protein [Bdellovibrionota bacterium]|nr:right-handed parallel beta-helix repeat-containing protein [Bdellovibrionota bacterium]